MNIESAQYCLNESGQSNGVIIVADGITSYVPLDGKSWVNRALNEWVEAGHEIAPAPTQN